MKKAKGLACAKAQRKLHRNKGLIKDYSGLEGKSNHAYSMISQLSPYDCQLDEIQLAALQLKDASLNREFSNYASENDWLLQEIYKSNYSLEVLKNIINTREQELRALEFLEIETSYLFRRHDYNEKDQSKLSLTEWIEYDNTETSENMSEKRKLLIIRLDELRILENQILQTKRLIERRRKELSRQDTEIQDHKKDICVRDSSPVLHLGFWTGSNPAREKEPIVMHNTTKYLLYETPAKGIKNEEILSSTRFHQRAKFPKRIGIYEAAILLLVGCVLLFHIAY